MAEINKDDLTAKFTPETKTIMVKAWGGDVTIKKLTISEQAKYTDLLLKGKTTEDVGEDKTMAIGLDDAREATLLRVSMSLVSPRFKPEELGELSENAQAGITEISEALDAWDKPKKSKAKNTSLD